MEHLLMLHFSVSVEKYLSYKFINSLVELFYGVKIVVFDGIDNAGRHVLFKNHSAH